jgi:hypothetical protein
MFKVTADTLYDVAKIEAIIIEATSKLLFVGPMNSRSQHLQIFKNNLTQPFQQG